MRKQIHVLHTFANNDGVPYITWFMERAQREQTVRFSFLLLCPQRPKMLEEIERFGFSGTWVRFDHRKRKRSMLLALPQMWWHMVKHQPDIVHGHLFDDSLPAMLAARLAGIRARLITRQDTGYHLYYAPKWVFMDRLTTRLATRVVAVSGQAKQLMVQYENAPLDKIAVVHHGISTAPYARDHSAEVDALKKKYALQHAFPVVGTVARLIEWKGYRHIIAAASILVKKHPRIHFLFCGTGPQEAELRALVATHRLEAHITFTGWVERGSMPALHSTFDIYLHAADHEPFGFVLAEAMMAGTPVVSTRTGGIADVAEDGRSAIFVPERSGPALAEGVERALRTGLEGIGANGKEVALRAFMFDTMWKGYLHEYEKAITG